MTYHLKEVLSSCKNYDYIINCTISTRDVFSQNLIKFYQDYVFFNWSSSDNIKLLDIIIFAYITDQKFNEYVHNIYLETENDLPIFEDLVRIYRTYEDSKFKIVDNTIWI